MIKKEKNEVILHAASQDLPCLRDWGLSPKKIFDTELGARLAGFPKVGLGSLIEEFFHKVLAIIKQPLLLGRSNH